MRGGGRKRRKEKRKRKWFTERGKRGPWGPGTGLGVCPRLLPLAEPCQRPSAAFLGLSSSSSSLPPGFYPGGLLP